MASSSASTNVGNMVMVTHMVPAAPTREQQPLSEKGHRFMKGQPTALGTVQIMVGVVVLVFTIAIVGFQPSLGLYSGIFVWGALLYIASGSVTVAAGKYLSFCLMKASLVLNIIAAVVAAIGIMVYTVDAAIFDIAYGRSYCPDIQDGSSGFQPFSGFRPYYPGFSIVLAVFQLLQFIISIIVAGFSCSATCGCCMEEGLYYNRALLDSAEPPAYETAS